MYFCIVGTGRSGTTLLRNIFNSHPDLFVFNETHWIIKMFEMYGTGTADVERLIHIIRSTHHISGVPVTPIDEKKMQTLFDLNDTSTVEEFCDTIGNMFAKENKKKIWGDKTPDYGPFMHILQLLWPKCKFIHVIRHGADVAISMSKHPGYQWLASANEDSWVPVSYNKYYTAIKEEKKALEEFSALWYRRLKRIQDESKLLNSNTYCEIFFENLIKNPVEELRLLTDYLELSAPESWFEEAKNIIEPKRFQFRKRNQKFLRKREKRLLEKLGYK